MSYQTDSTGNVSYTHLGERPNMPPSAAEAKAKGAPTAASVDAYLEKKLNHPEYANDQTLRQGLERAREAGMPEIAISAMQGQFLTIIAKSIRAEKILEVGTLGGYSTTFLAKALPSHGQIDTIEYSPLHAQIAQQNFLETDLFPFPKVHIGNAVDILRSEAFARPPGTVEGLPEDQRGYDLVFIDADKENYFECFQESIRLTRKGGLIIIDNAVRGGRITQDTNDQPQIDVVGLRKVYDWVEKDAGKTVLMSAIQTVGAKFWDGFAIAIKL